MRSTIEIGPVPGEESCEQLGENYSAARAKAECRAYINQLKRIHGEPPAGASYVITSNSHDFGTYHEVGIRFDDQNTEATEYAYKVDEDTPANWDDESKVELERKLLDITDAEARYALGC